MKFSQFLNEASEGQNVHLEHICEPSPHGTWNKE